MSHDLTVGQLRAMLEDLDDDTVIRVATQSSYPLQLVIDDEIRRLGDVAYLRAEDHPYGDSPYLPKSVFGDVDLIGELRCAYCDEPTLLVVDLADELPADELPEPICRSCARRHHMETRELDPETAVELLAALVTRPGSSAELPGLSGCKARLRRAIMTRRALLAIALLLLVALPADERSTPEQDCFYDQAQVDAMTDAQLDDLTACLDRYGWTYDEN
jgi:hypothetical protein